MAKVALQLFSIKDIANERGIFSALQVAKALGYDGVELAGYKGKTVPEIKEELDRLGLEVAGAHINVQEIKNTPNIVEDLKLLGAYSICVPHYKIESLDDAIACGKAVNELAPIFKDTGIKFGYHNHATEYKEAGSKFYIDYIFEQCNMDEVFYELDTRHVAYAGFNPTVEAIKYSGKIPVLHARDFNGTDDCAVGEGVVDFKSVVKEANGVEWFVVENGNIGSNLEELRRSLIYLKENF